MSSQKIDFVGQPSRTGQWTKWISQAVVFAMFLGASIPANGQCTMDAECDDGLFCTFDVCFLPGPSGQCLNPTRTCQDGLYCNGTEQCSESRDLCEFACVGGTICDNGFCVCNDGGGCPNGNVGQACNIFIQPVNCPPGQVCNEALDACTECSQNSHCTQAPELRCNLSTGECVECITNSHCQDSSFCNGQETCNTTSGFCEPGSPVQCDFGEFCSELLFRCVECENVVDCDDGLYCNGAEQCIDDQCVAGTPVNCSAIDPLKPFCHEASDTCVACLTDAHCNDGLFCTADACVFNECLNSPDPEQFCDDGLYCNGVEQCNAGNTGCITGTPPSCSKTCFQGPTPGAACTTDAQCGKACKEGASAGQSCAADINCGRTCAGGSNNGMVCTDDEQCASRNCTSRGLCATGICRGGCSESFDQCVQCAPDVPGSTSCSDGLFCTGTETCSAGHACVASPRQHCESFNTDCTKGLCNEAADACGPTNRANGSFCDDDSHCTRVDECQSGACIEKPPAESDPYRCVHLELIKLTQGTIGVGSTVEIKLQARAQNCNVFSSWCPSDHHPLTGIEAILSWDPSRLELQPSVSGNLNPADPCDSANPCFTCPVGTYNWEQSNFPFDCLQGDGINAACSGPVPSNDGDALYRAVSQLSCNGEPAAPACVRPTGLHVTTFKFKVLVGAQGTNASVQLLPCAGDITLSRAVSNVLPPEGYFTSDVTKSLGSPVAFNVAACTLAGQCNDNDPCTDDACVNGQCRNTPKNCTHPDPCIIGSCNPTTGVCQQAPIQCGSGNRCYQGDCYKVCTTVADCNDGHACTQETCQAVPGDDICIYTLDHAVCDTGHFCSAQRCDFENGCIFDHECYSSDGNPCPDNNACDDVSDTCGGCFPPEVEVSGCRYLTITPQDQGSTQVALLIEGDCLDSAVGCASKYVESNCKDGLSHGQSCATSADCPKSCATGPSVGLPCTNDFDCNAGGGACRGVCEKRLGDTPTFLTAAQWGTVSVSGNMMRPNTRYQVMADCDLLGGRVLSAATPATTWQFGDADGNTFINVLDISVAVEFLKEIATVATFESTNMGPCAIDLVVNVIDVATIVDAVRSTPFACPAPCP